MSELSDVQTSRGKVKGNAKIVRVIRGIRALGKDKMEYRKSSSYFAFELSGI